jgi:hypothetical protein
MHIRGFHLQHKTVPELLEKVVKSHAAYDGKDCIKFARKTSGQHAADSRLQRLGIQTVSLAELLSTAAVSHGPSSHVPPSNESEAQSSHRVRAAEKIQRFWRSHRPTLLARRKFLTTSAGRLYTAMLEICKQCTASKTIRYLLTGRGIGVIENIRSLSRSMSELQGSAGKLITSVPQEKFERVDELLECLRSRWRASPKAFLRVVLKSWPEGTQGRRKGYFKSRSLSSKRWEETVWRLVK